MLSKLPAVLSKGIVVIGCHFGYEVGSLYLQ